MHKKLPAPTRQSVLERGEEGIKQDARALADEGRLIKLRRGHRFEGHYKVPPMLAYMIMFSIADEALAQGKMEGLDPPCDAWTQELKRRVTEVLPELQSYHNTYWETVWINTRKAGVFKTSEKTGRKGQPKREELVRRDGLYSKYLVTEHWERIRAQTIEACYHACIFCNGDRSLECHHRTYKNLGNEMPIRDTIILCAKCHKATHKRSPELLEPWSKDIRLRMENIVEEDAKARRTQIPQTHVVCRRRPDNGIYSCPTV